MGGALPEPRLDFPFTERDAPEARGRIEHDLRIVVETVFARDPAVVALVLVGGFSRGEGTVRDGAPVNDYDLVAVRSRPGGRALHAQLGRELTERIGLEVDLMPAWEARLPRVGRKLFWLDLVLGGKVIAGDERVLSRVRTFGPESIPLQEPARLLGNRAAGLLLAVPGSEPLDAEQVRLQAAKALIAAMDARLLAEGRYAARLRDRVKLAEGMPDHEAFARAVNWKLAGADVGDPVAWWTLARDALLRAVDATGARDARDGLIEHAFHLVQGRRLRASPSRALRRATWDLLQGATLPEGPADPEGARRILARMGRVEAAEWPDLKRRFFELRAQTLQ